jgi:hypothetical protein
MKILNYSLLILFILLASCASKKDRRFVEKSTDGIEENFNIQKETLAKFKTVKVPENIAKQKKIKKKKLKKKKSKVLKKDIQKKNHSEQVKEEEKALSGFSYPKGYPEVFKKYDRTSAPIWDLFEHRLFEGEEIVFKVSYLGIHAGFIKMQTKGLAEISGESVFHFKAQLRSAKYYEYVYTLDDTLESYIRSEDFAPLKYILAQRESSQVVDDLQLFDHDELKTYSFYKRIKENRNKDEKKVNFVPRYFQDSYSALYFVRGLPLKLGDRYEFPVVTRGKIWLLKIKVEKYDEIKIMDKWVKTIRLSAETHFPGVLKKKGDILFWYSADETRKLLKFEAKIKIGSAKGEMVEYKAGTPFKY